jgi:type IV pilus assembly protein PilO
MELSLTKLPWYAQVGAFVALAIAGCGAFYYYYERAAQADLTARRKQLVALRADITKGVTTAKQLPAFETEVNDLEARLDNLRAVLPEEKDAADLLRRMQTVATQSNLVIKGFKPAPVVTKQLHAEWPIQLDLEGSYHNLATFFDRVGKFTRIVNITGVDVKGKDKPGDVNATISATCVATTFVLLDAPALAAARDKAAKGAKPGAKPAAKPAAAKKAA